MSLGFLDSHKIGNLSVLLNERNPPAAAVGSTQALIAVGEEEKGCWMSCHVVATQCCVLFWSEIV